MESCDIKDSKKKKRKIHPNKMYLMIDVLLISNYFPIFQSNDSSRPIDYALIVGGKNKSSLQQFIHAQHNVK